LIAEGEIIDRVLAGPGDQARWEDGRLWVNGRPSDLLPLNPARITGPLKWSIPQGHYLILPSASVAINANMPTELWQHVAVISGNDIIGRVYFRSSPLSRWGFIR
jgi:hypothetical protein